MYVGGELTLGMSGAEEYVFHFHETFESGKFYYLRIACPVLGKDESESHLIKIATYRTDIFGKGSFRNILHQDDIDYEILYVGKSDKYVIANQYNMEEKFEEFLEMFVENELYKSIPEIKEYMKMYPHLKV